MRISDWSSDVCSSDLEIAVGEEGGLRRFGIVPIALEIADRADAHLAHLPLRQRFAAVVENREVDERLRRGTRRHRLGEVVLVDDAARSEERTSELQSLMRITYAVFCLTKTTNKRK